MGTLRLLRNVKATVEEPKGRGNVAKVSTLPRSKKTLMFVKTLVNGKASKALVDTGATHNFFALTEETRLGLRYTKEPATLKTVDTFHVPIHGVARDVSLRLGEWKGTVDLTVITMDDFSMVLGLEFMDTVAPWTMQRDEMMIIARHQEACSVLVSREVVEAKMLSVVQVKKGIKKEQATFVATLIEEGPQPNEVSKERQIGRTCALVATCFSSSTREKVVCEAGEFSFAQDEVSFLGHRIKAGKIMMARDKVQSINEWDPPKNVSDVRSFLGLANYYRRFILSYSARAAPLTDLVKKKVQCHWSEKCQEMFNDLKKAVTEELVLDLPDYAKPFELHTDASDFAIGGVLMQEGHHIAYESRKLNDTERG
ncbi:hypothetical protein SOVF_047350, partial [Spinacia oleracea]